MYEFILIFCNKKTLKKIYEQHNYNEYLFFFLGSKGRPKKYYWKCIEIKI